LVVPLWIRFSTFLVPAPVLFGWIVCNAIRSRKLVNIKWKPTEIGGDLGKHDFSASVKGVIIGRILAISDGPSKGQ